jgi:uncharacterized membrane protein
LMYSKLGDDMFSLYWLWLQTLFSQMKASVIGILYKKHWNLVKSAGVIVILSRVDKSWIENHRWKRNDKLEQLLIQKELEHWKNILTRLINTVLYTAEHSMAFLVRWVSCTHKIIVKIFTPHSVANKIHFRNPGSR